MAVERYQLTFAGGETREVTRRPIHMVRAETIDASGATLTFVYASLWAADTGGVGDRDDFERWLETVDSFDRASEEVAEVDPPDQGGSGSPD